MVEKLAELLGKTNGALNTKIKMRAAGMTDDDANNRSLQNIVQQICKELNAGCVTLSFNASSAKEPPPVSPFTLPSTDVSYVTALWVAETLP